MFPKEYYPGGYFTGEYWPAPNKGTIVGGAGGRRDVFMNVFDNVFDRSFRDTFGFIPSDSFVPTDVSGLVLWLDASVGVSTTVDQVDSWLDQSGNSNTATSSGTTRPIFDATDMNGFPTLVFDGINDLMTCLDSASLDLNDNFTMYFVQKKDVGSGIGNYVSKNQNNNYRVRARENMFLTTIVNDGGGLQEDVSPNKIEEGVASIIEFHYESGGEIDFTENGNTLGRQSNTLTGINTSAANLIIGSTGTSEYYEGSISQILIYNRLLTEGERNQVGNYLANRYNLTWKQTPKSISDMALWLDASVGITLNVSNVAVWRDQSGNQNDAAQVEPLDQPVFGATDINGEPAVRFLGEFLEIEDSATMNFTGSFTSYMLVELNNAATTRMFYTQDGNNGVSIRVNTTDFMQTTINNVSNFSSSSVQESTPILLEVRYQMSGTVNYTENGLSLGNIATAVSSIPVNTAITYIGAFNDSGTNPLSGEMGQLMIFEKLLTTAERNQVGKYLCGRYNITWTAIT